MQRRPKVAVVGAGIIGLSCAYQILCERSPHQYDVTVISEKFSPDTTGDISAGLFRILRYGDGNNIEDIKRWNASTWEYLVHLKKTTEANAVPLAKFIKMYNMSSDVNMLKKVPFWSHLVHGFRTMTDAEVAVYTSLGARCGFFFETIVLDVSAYQQWALKRIKSFGGKVIRSKVHDLEELYGDYDIIINCTALGSYDLVKDKTIYPISGEIFKVLAPLCQEVVTILDGKQELYVIPGCNSIVTVGGTFDKDNWDTTVNRDVKDAIMEKAVKMCPSLENGVVLRDCVGLRPHRDSIRLESEPTRTGRRAKFVIHNYGHGGTGANLFWGCAADTLTLLNQCFPTSKL